MVRWRATGVRVLVLLAAAALAGCAALQPPEIRYLQQSRYGELEEHMRAEIKDPARAPFARLFYLCFAHSRVKRYGELFTCLDHLERRVAAGDHRVFVFDFAAAPPLMRAEALIELGQYRRALAEARRAADLVRPSNAYLQLRVYALTAAATVPKPSASPPSSRR